LAQEEGRRLIGLGTEIAALRLQRARGFHDHAQLAVAQANHGSASALTMSKKRS
jgi:hypothetical protein